MDEYGTLVRNFMRHTDLSGEDTTCVFTVDSR